MRIRTSSRVVVGIAVVWAVALFSSSASAYGGPGAGISALGTLFSIFSALVLAIIGFVWYPVKRLLKVLRKRRESPKQ